MKINAFTCTGPYTMLILGAGVNWSRRSRSAPVLTTSTTSNADPGRELMALVEECGDGSCVKCGG